MKIKNPILYLMLCFVLSNCTSKKDLLGKKYPIEGQWQLTELRTNTPADFNGDGSTSTNLYEQLDDCYTQNILVLEYNPIHSFNAFWVYTGADNPSSCPDIEHHQIRILPSQQYLPKEATLNFIHKYFVDTHRVLALNDETLEIEGNQLLSYKNDPLQYTKTISRFKRLTPEEEIDVVTLMKDQDLFPYLTIYGTVQAVEAIENGQVLTVQLHENNIFTATIKRENLWKKSLDKTFEVGDEAILKGDTKFENGSQTMIVNMIY